MNCTGITSGCPSSDHMAERRVRSGRTGPGEGCNLRPGPRDVWTWSVCGVVEPRLSFLARGVLIRGQGRGAETRWGCALAIFQGGEEGVWIVFLLKLSFCSRSCEIWPDDGIGGKWPDTGIFFPTLETIEAENEPLCPRHGGFRRSWGPEPGPRQMLGPSMPALLFLDCLVLAL